MAYRIELTPAAGRDFKRLPESVRRRIAPRIDALADEPRPAGVLSLTGMHGYYRLRVGDYRVIYKVEDDHLLVLVIRVANRREAYR
uniref:Addiction module toxin, RelE/StbE family n=1 Tax=Desulfovibrio sp. U5L TaxID=596152 RepID=I2Q5W0_9BACT